MTLIASNVLMDSTDYRFTKKKKVGWFTRWFDRKAKQAWERAQEEVVPKPLLQAEPINLEGINIRISGATGGTIVEFRSYDRIKDRHNTKLYVISSSEDFSDSFSKIVTLEMMR